MVQPARPIAVWAQDLVIELGRYIYSLGTFFYCRMIRITMEALLESCERYQQYPLNLLQTELPQRTLLTYNQRLQQLRRNLFVQAGALSRAQLPSKSAVEVLDFDGQTQGGIWLVLRRVWALTRAKQNPALRV